MSVYICGMLVSSVVDKVGTSPGLVKPKTLILSLWFDLTRTGTHLIYHTRDKHATDINRPYLNMIPSSTNIKVFGLT
jgi:hypothetical protein